MRRARSLVVTFRESRPHVFNFLTRKLFQCSAEGIAFLAACNDWRSVSSLQDSFEAFDKSSVVREIAHLVRAGGLVVSGTKEAHADEDYASGWEWNEAAGYLHFGIRDTQFMTDDETAELLKTRLTSRPSPPLYTKNCEYSSVSQLQHPDMREPIFQTMLQRRSERKFASEPISTQNLADCLFVGLGITAFVDEPIVGRLPMKMTPSGGARNPYEAYVCVQNVEGLRSGVYHYSALEHSLGFISETNISGRTMLGGQEWAASAPAIVLLVANFARTMWKYPHPTAYRVVLIEAGHIVQNIALAATARQLVATPTAAICESAIEQAIGISSVLEAPVYAVAIGAPGKGFARWFDI